VKLKSGRMAWVDMEQADFEGIDLLGALIPAPSLLNRHQVKILAV
jgi:hypothetical protein